MAQQIKIIPNYDPDEHNNLYDPNYDQDEYKELYDHIMERNRELFIALVHIKHLLADVDITPITRQEIEGALEKVGL